MLRWRVKLFRATADAEMRTVTTVEVKKMARSSCWRSNFWLGATNSRLFRHEVCTEGEIKVCTWLREISSCSCLTVLPGPAWVLLSKTYKPLFPPLYTYYYICCLHPSTCEKHDFHIDSVKELVEFTDICGSTLKLLDLFGHPSTRYFLYGMDFASPEFAFINCCSSSSASVGRLSTFQFVLELVKSDPALIASSRLPLPLYLHPLKDKVSTHCHIAICNDLFWLNVGTKCVAFKSHLSRTHPDYFMQRY